MMNDWISVKERLPEEQQYVIVYSKINFPTLALYHNKNFYSGIKENGWYENITYWMPLPEPPKE